MESPHSPEAEIGHIVEDLWDIQEPQLSPSEKLNSCFENIPVSSFPPPPNQVIEIPSDSTLANAVETLSKHKILSAPVVNVEAPEDASWIDKYIGIVEFAGIAVWLLHQSEKEALKMITGAAATRLAAGYLAATLGSLELGTATSGIGGAAVASAAASGVATAAGSAKSGPHAADSTMAGSFLESLISSDFYRNTKVQDISGSFRWAPFLALQKSDSFLTMLLLLSKYRMKSLPVVDLGEGKIDNIITQSSVVHMLAECVGLHWFEDWGTKTLVRLGLPVMKPERLYKVKEDEPVLKAFELMRKKGIGGVPVVNESGNKAVGNISIRDVQYLFTAPDIYNEYRSISAKNYLAAVRNHLEKQQETSPMLKGVITCKKYDTIKDIILKLDSQKIQRIYVVDEDDNLEGVITLRDIISRLVHEPRGYFGDFFDVVVPLPQNSRV